MAGERALIEGLKGITMTTEVRTVARIIVASTITELQQELWDAWLAVFSKMGFDVKTPFKEYDQNHARLCADVRNAIWGPRD